MAYTRGVFKNIVICEEETYGTAPAGSSVTARNLRRVNGVFTLGRDVIRSQELLPSMQVRDARHGVYRMSGSLSGQLSPGAYRELFSGILRKTWSTGVSNHSATVSVPTAGVNYVFFRRATGSWLTSGLKLGDVINITGFTGTDSGTDTTAYNNRRFRIVAMTTTDLTCRYDRTATHTSGISNLNEKTITTPQAATFSLPGSKTYIPATGQDFKSFTIEQYFHDADTNPISELFTGCMVQALRVSIPAGGIATIDAQIVGQDMYRDGTRYFSAAAPVSTDQSFTGISGNIRVAGVDRAWITGIQFQISAPMDAPATIGSFQVPQLFPGTLQVEGTLTALTPDFTLQDNFLNANEISIHIYLSSTYSASSPFMSFIMPRVKLFSADKNDSDRAIVQTLGFQALEIYSGVGTGTAYDGTTFTVQDSSFG